MLKENIDEIVQTVTANQALSYPEQALEVATRVMDLVKIPQHQETVGKIVDQMTELGVVITQGSDPEKLAPEQLKEIVEQQEK